MGPRLFGRKLSGVGGRDEVRIGSRAGRAFASPAVGGGNGGEGVRDGGSVGYDRSRGKGFRNRLLGGEGTRFAEVWSINHQEFIC